MGTIEFAIVCPSVRPLKQTYSWQLFWQTRWQPCVLCVEVVLTSWYTKLSGATVVLLYDLFKHGTARTGDNSLILWDYTILKQLSSSKYKSHKMFIVLFPIENNHLNMFHTKGPSTTRCLVFVFLRMLGSYLYGIGFPWHMEKCSFYNSILDLYMMI